MKQLFLLLFISFIASSISFAQGTIRGKVTDENGETVIGASITLQSNHSIATMTDLDGSYSLKIYNSTPQIITISFVSYKPIQDSVNPKNDEVIIKNFTLQPSVVKLQDVVITGRATKAKEGYM